MNEPRRRLTNHALHGKEEWFKRVFRDQIAEAAGNLEVVLSAIVLIALLMSVIPLLKLMPGLLTDADSMEVHTFLKRALDIVIGIEFIKMLAKHSPGSVLEVRDIIRKTNVSAIRGECVEEIFRDTEREETGEDAGMDTWFASDY